MIAPSMVASFAHAGSGGYQPARGSRVASTWARIVVTGLHQHVTWLVQPDALNSDDTYPSNSFTPSRSSRSSFSVASIRLRLKSSTDRPWTIWYLPSLIVTG